MTPRMNARSPKNATMREIRMDEDRAIAPAGQRNGLLRARETVAQIMEYRQGDKTASTMSAPCKLLPHKLLGFGGAK